MNEKPTYEELEQRIGELERNRGAYYSGQDPYREIYEAAKDTFLIFDRNGVIREVNPAACHMYGYSREEMIGLTGRDIVHPDYRHLFKTFVKKASEGVIFSAESVDIRKDGSTFDIEVHGSGVTYNGEPHLLAVVRDITERKRVEQALRESEEKYRSLFENAVEGIFQTTLDGRYISANPALARMFEYDSPQALMESVTNIGEQHYSDPQRRELFKKTLETKGQITNFQVRSITKTGATIWVSVNARAVKDETGSVRYFEGTITDITDRKRAEETLRESEERYHLLWDVTLEGILVHRDGIVVDLNSSLETMFGYKKEELLNKNILKIGFHPEDIPIVRENIVKEYAEPYTIRCIKKNKEIFFAEIEARNFRMKDESLRVAAVRDITFRKQAEDALRERESKFRSIFENKGTATGIFGEDRIIRECNTVFVELSGYAKSEIIHKKKWSDFVVREDLERLQIYHAQRSKNAGSAPAQYECRIVNKNGQILDVIINISLVGEDRIVSLTDITDRKKVEEALRAERERFQYLSENAPFGMAMIGSEGTFKYINPKFSEIFGYDLSEIPDGRTWFRKAYPDPAHRHRVISTWLEDLNSSQVGQKRPRVFEVECKDGSKKIVNFVTVQLETGENLMACEDITIRRQAEEALRKSEKQFRELFNSVSDLVYTHDLDGRILSMNAALCKTFGYDEKELLGRKVSEFMKPEFVKAFESEYLKNLKKKGYYEGTTAYLTKDGNQIYLEYRSSLVYPDEGKPYITGIGRDVTAKLLSERENRKLQDRLNQAQKLESLGILAGGIAHNFNNILMGIQGRASLMMMEKDSSDPDHMHLRGIEKYVNDAVVLTRDLLGFARGGKYEVRSTNLNKLIEHESKLFARTKKEIQIHEEYEKGLWTVEVDQGQIKQVLLNLYVNAAYAMPAGGDLYIRTEKVTLDEKAAKPSDIPPGNYVKTSVTDTGVGMEKTIQEKIFDPFFSTRDASEGSGLGLASVYGIIKNHGGFINVYSEREKGTTFTIYLPASEKKTVKEVPHPDQGEPQYGQETILLVDDEEFITEIGQGLLKRLGYQVITAGSGQAALNLYEARKDGIDLVILDMIMPEMGGGPVYDRLKEINPGVKVLLSSGYSVDGQATDILNKGCNGFIQKPFSLQGLSIKVREVLDDKISE